MGLRNGWDRQIFLRYGGKRAWLKHMWFLWLGWAGAYDRFRRVEWTRVERVLFVCSGNICRSPYGEARARALGVEALSFGLLASENNHASPLAVAVARDRGLDLGSHRSRPLLNSALSDGDLLVAMEPWQAQQLEQKVAGTQAQITILGLWDQPSRPYLHDPYGSSKQYFDVCFAALDSAIERIALELKTARAH